MRALQAGGQHLNSFYLNLHHVPGFNIWDISAVQTFSKILLVFLFSKWGQSLLSARLTLKNTEFIIKPPSSIF